MNKLHGVLGYAGLIPFVMLPILFQLGYLQSQGWLISYAALIFSFLGGVQWMATLNASTKSFVKQTISVSAMLWAWLWLIVPQVDWLILAGLSFWIMWLYERVSFKALYSVEFMLMRRNLSLVAGTSLILAGLL